MKKTLIALAAVAASSAAMAQVTVGGTFNLDMQNTIAAANATAAAKKTAKKDAVGMGDAIVSFAVSEDLGGGIKASASTTLQTNNGRSSAVTNNGYSMALTGGFGGLSFTNALIGWAETSAGVSAEIDMNDAAGGYFVRNRLQYALPAIVPGLGIQLRWDQTQLQNENITGAVTTSTTNSLTPTTATRRVTPTAKGTDGKDATLINFDYTIGNGYISYGAKANDLAGGGAVYVGYNFGFAKVDAAFTNYDLESYGNANFADHSEIAVTAPLGSALTAGVHVMMGDIVDAYGVRATYALSKRTAVSLNYVDVSNTTVGSTGKGENYRVRVSHSF